MSTGRSEVCPPTCGGCQQQGWSSALSAPLPTPHNTVHKGGGIYDRKEASLHTVRWAGIKSCAHDNQAVFEAELTKRTLSLHVWAFT